MSATKRDCFSPARALPMSTSRACRSCSAGCRAEVRYTRSGGSGSSWERMSCWMIRRVSASSWPWSWRPSSMARSIMLRTTKQGLPRARSCWNRKASFSVKRWAVTSRKQS